MEDREFIRLQDLVAQLAADAWQTRGTPAELLAIERYEAVRRQLVDHQRSRTNPRKPQPGP